MFKSGCCRKQFKSTIKLLYIEFCDAHLWIMSVIRTTERIVEHRRKQQQIVGINCISLTFFVHKCDGWNRKTIFCKRVRSNNGHDNGTTIVGVNVLRAIHGAPMSATKCHNTNIYQLTQTKGKAPRKFKWENKNPANAIFKQY